MPTITTDSIVASRRPTDQEQEAVCQFVRDEAARRGLSVKLHTNLIYFSELGTMVLPVTLGIDEDTWAGDKALGEINDAWNYRQEPEPTLRLFITLPH